MASAINIYTNNDEMRLVTIKGSQKLFFFNHKWYKRA